jgi:putative ABC transport system substrate-binding protein
MVRRRDFIAGLGGATAFAWPLAARAQQPAMPVIGYLSFGTPEEGINGLAAFRKGLSEMGYVEGRNVAIEFRFAQNDGSRLPELAADLIRRRVAVIASLGGAATLAAKALTRTIPIVFAANGDPVQLGIVASLNRPGGNVTGINTLSGELGPKNLGLIHELLPRATRFALLINTTSAGIPDTVIPDLRAAAAAIGREIEFFHASTNAEIDTAFASLVQKRTDALLVQNQTLFRTRRAQILTLAARHAVPVIYGERAYVEAGGLMSYGPSASDPNRLGIYAGRILKGEQPADLPVIRSAKFEFLINLQTAKTLSIEVPPTLLAIADEVIE